MSIALKKNGRLRAAINLGNPVLAQRTAVERRRPWSVP
jgi:hypothetical protein